MAKWWSRPSLDRALACAIVAHALAAFFVARSRLPVASHGDAPPPSTLEIEVSQEALPRSDTPAAPPAETPPAVAAVVPPQSAPGAQAREREKESAPPNDTVATGGDGSPSDGTATAAGASGAPAAAGSASAGNGAPGGHAPLSLGALGLAGPNRYMGNSHDQDGPTPEQMARSLEKKIAEDLMVHDRALGLGADGPVIAALEVATAAGTTPVNGRAVFRVIADSEGTVTELVAVDVSEGRGAWEEAATRALRDLKGKKLRMPIHGKNAKGVSMHIEITSANKMPSGADPGTDVTVLHIPIKKGEGKKSARVDLLDPIPKVVTVDPPADSTSPVKLPHQEVQWTIINMQGDLSDIGARPRRVIHGRVLDQHLL